MTSANKNAKLLRTTADRLLNELMERVKEYNSEPFNPYMVTKIVVFGSYVNEPDWEKISDLDIGFRLDRRYADKAFRLCDDSAAITSTMRMPSLERQPWYMITWEYALRFLKGRSKYISLHNEKLLSEREYIYSKNVKEMDVGEIARMADTDVIEWFRSQSQ